MSRGLILHVQSSLCNLLLGFLPHLKEFFQELRTLRDGGVMSGHVRDQGWGVSTIKEKGQKLLGPTHEETNVTGDPGHEAL